MRALDQAKVRRRKKPPRIVRNTCSLTFDILAQACATHDVIPLWPRVPVPAVPADAAPLFIASAANDPISSTAGPALFSAWTTARKSAEIHVYFAGGHGFGMSTLNLPSDTWIDRFGDWLRAQNLIRGALKD